MAEKICSLCGSIIRDFSMILNNKVVCTNCYNKEIERLEKEESAREELLKYIKEMFGCECPSDVIGLIDKADILGKKISGIKATIWYYYGVLENSHTPADIQYLYKNINDNYENARKYVEERRQLHDKNMAVNINVPANTVTIHSSRDDRKKPQYKMEDL